MITVLRKGYDITGMTVSCRVDRSISAAGAQASVTVIYSVTDIYMPRINPACGDDVVIKDGDSVIFDGIVERLEFSAGSLAVTMICFDKASLLAKNEIYATFSGSPGNIAAKVCGLLGLTAGQIWQKPGSVYIPAGCAASAYSIIRTAYDGKCVTMWNGGKLDILEPGARQAQIGSDALLEATARHSVEAMVNRAEIIGYKGRTDGVAQSAGDISAYGLRQRVYSLTGARSTAARQALSYIGGLGRQASVTVLGGQNIFCGDSVELGFAEYGINGKWIVSSSGLMVQGGVATTALGLTEL